MQHRPGPPPALTPEGVLIRLIKAARALLDWSQEDLAEKVGYEVTWVRKLESGARMRGVTEAFAIARQALERGGVRFTSAGVELVRTPQRVKKTTGDYEFVGHVVAKFYKRGGAVRYVVEDDRGVCLIMNGKQIGIEESGT